MGLLPSKAICFCTVLIKRLYMKYATYAIFFKTLNLHNCYAVDGRHNDTYYHVQEIESYRLLLKIVGYCF